MRKVFHVSKLKENLSGKQEIIEQTIIAGENIEEALLEHLDIKNDNFLITRKDKDLIKIKLYNKDGSIEKFLFNYIIVQSSMEIQS